MGRAYWRPYPDIVGSNPQEQKLFFIILLQYLTVMVYVIIVYGADIRILGDGNFKTYCNKNLKSSLLCEAVLFIYRDKIWRYLLKIWYLAIMSFLIKKQS